MPGAGGTETQRLILQGALLSRIDHGLGRFSIDSSRRQDIRRMQLMGKLAALSLTQRDNLHAERGHALC